MIWLIARELCRKQPFINSLEKKFISGWFTALFITPGRCNQGKGVFTMQYPNHSFVLHGDLATRRRGTS